MASSARPRDPGWRNRGDAAPRRRVPAPSRTLLAGRAEGRPARPGHRQFTARGLRLPAAVTITICKALPADAHLAEPTGPRSGRGAARRSEFQGPPQTDTEGPGGWASRASQLRLAGGLRRHCEVPATVAPQPRSLPTLLGPGHAGKWSPCPRGTAKDCPRALCPAGRGVAPVPAASSPGPAPLLHFLRRRPS